MGALCKREVELGVPPADVVRIRVGERGGVAIRARDRDAHELTGADPDTAEHGVAGRVAVDDRGRRLEPQRLLHRRRQERRIVFDERALLGVCEEVQSGIRDHPFRRLDSAEEQDRGVRDDLVAGKATGCTGRSGDERG